MKNLIHVSSRRYSRWAVAGAGLICMPLAAQAADGAGWQAGLLADTGTNLAVHGAVSSSPYAGTWRQAGSSLNAPSSPDHITSVAAKGPSLSPDARFVADSRMAAYLAAPTAQLAYGSLMVDGLHRRLGEIRNVMPTRDVGGEAFVRYTGGSFDYAGGTDQRDARHQADALQIGGGIALWNEDGGNHRVGWALDKGALRVRPKSTNSYADYDVTGLSAWYTHQRESGGYVDAVLNRTKYDGRAWTQGASGPKARASQWAASIETGYPLRASENVVVEPQAQLKFQSLRTSTVLDGDVIRTARTNQTSARIGARIARIDNERFVPYLKVDIERRFGEARRIQSAPANGAASTIADDARSGTTVGLSAGMTIKVNRTVDFYADAKTQKHLGGQGSDGWSAGAGVRINF